MQLAIAPNLRWTHASARWLRRAWARLGRLSLATRFLAANLMVFVAATLVLGSWVGAQIEAAVLNRTASVTSLYVDSVISPQLQGLVRSTTLDPASVATIDRLLLSTSFGERIVALKVWAPDGTIVYSPNRELVGRRFPVDGGLAKALGRDVAVSISNLDEAENEYERARWSRLVEVYAPVFEDRGGPLIAVSEFYQLPDALEAAVLSAQLGSWAIVGLTMLAAYALLAGIVRAGSDTIVRQALALRERVSELQTAVAENDRLQARVAHAARSATATNEQFLRRISADLHDGPAQALALALLRLDELPAARSVPVGDVVTVRQSVADALVEIRSIAAGLRSPDLEPLSPAEVIERAMRDHERRTGARVEISLEGLPARAPLAIKIALHRILQEALSNATRHGRTDVISVRASASADTLVARIRDGGRGIVGAEGEGLGIAGMRERAELLGGSFAIESAPGGGTEVTVSLPLRESDK